MFEPEKKVHKSCSFNQRLYKLLLKNGSKKKPTKRSVNATFQSDERFLWQRQDGADREQHEKVTNEGILFLSLSLAL